MKILCKLFKYKYIRYTYTFLDLILEWLSRYFFKVNLTLNHYFSIKSQGKYYSSFHKFFVQKCIKFNDFWFDKF